MKISYKYFFLVASLAVVMVQLPSCNKKVEPEKQVELVYEKKGNGFSARGFVLKEKERFRNYAGFYLALDMEGFINQEHILQVTHQDKNGNILNVQEGKGFPDPQLCQNIRGISEPYDSLKFSIWETQYFRRNGPGNKVGLAGEKFFIPYSWLTSKKGLQTFYIGLSVYESVPDTNSQADLPPVVPKKLYDARFKIKLLVPEIHEMKIHVDSLEFAMDREEAHKQDEVLFPFGKNYGFPDPQIWWSIGEDYIWVTPRADNEVTMGNMESPAIEYYEDSEEIEVEVFDEDMVGADDFLGKTTCRVSDICRRGNPFEFASFGKIRLLRVHCMPGN